MSHECAGVAFNLFPKKWPQELGTHEIIQSEPHVSRKNKSYYVLVYSVMFHFLLKKHSQVQKARLHKKKMRETGRTHGSLALRSSSPVTAASPRLLRLRLRSTSWTHTVTQLVALNTRPLRAVCDLHGPSSAFVWLPSRSESYFKLWQRSETRMPLE